jgi:hypothetical protein
MPMNLNSTDRFTLVVIAVITVAGFLLWLGGLVAIWIILRATGTITSFWEMTGALSTAAAVTAVLVAGYVAYRELGEVTSARHMEVADRLFEELNEPENIEARRWVFQNLSENAAETVHSLTPDERDVIKRVLNSLDRVAFLTQSGWITEETIMPWMNPMVVKTWIKLKPYVDYESKRRLEPDYYKSVRKLGERCIIWRGENLPNARITWLDDAL